MISGFRIAPGAALILFALLGGAVAPLGSPAMAADSLEVVRTNDDPIRRDLLHLGLAATAQARGDLRGVVHNLEQIAFRPEPSLDEADRAAFLLGQAYLKLGARDRFMRLVDDVSTWRRRTHYTRWLTYQRLMLENQVGERRPFAPDSGAAALPPGDPGFEIGKATTAAADELAASLLLKAGQNQRARRWIEGAGLAGAASPIGLDLDAVARVREGDSDEAALLELAAADTVSALGRDLAGAALVALATRALVRQQDANAVLERVPLGSRYAARARHMTALLALERGDAGRGIALLEALANDSTYIAAREARLALAGLALDQRRWEAAHHIYGETDLHWSRQRETLERRLAAGDFDSLWAEWQTHPGLSAMLPLDARPGDTLAGELAARSSRLVERSELEVPAHAGLERGPAPAWPIPPPPPAAWSAVAYSAARVNEAAAARRRVAWEADREREALADRRRFLEIGLQRLKAEAAALAARVGMLDSVADALASLDQRLQAVRDRAARRLEQRAAAIRAECAASLLWTSGMRRLYLEGPDRVRLSWRPLGHPGADSVVFREEALARAVEGAAGALSAEAPALLERSYREAWRPRLIESAGVQAAGARRALEWAHALEAALDSSIAACTTSDTLRALESRLADLGRTRDSLATAHSALRDSVARDAIASARSAMDSEREGIDYGLAASAYALGVRLGEAEAAARPASLGPTASADSLPVTGAEEEAEDAGTAAWRARAIPMMRAFLERHSESSARAEMRFRLADLELVEARAVFRRRMAAFLAGQSRGGEVPVLDHAGALELYKAILIEDPAFPHRDAVLFNAGMLLADQGDPEAERFFNDLVTIHGGSAYAQEAWLRMGDMRFQEKRFLESVAFYEKAAKLADPSLSVIAHYKVGWAHFNEDRFLEAADAFRSVLDLYASRRDKIQVDVEGEAESYLVHSLAGAGGAPAFAEYFDKIGKRPYERRMLLALGQHYRHYGEFPKAAAADQLAIQRDALHPDALVSAQRLMETWQRSDRLASEREARMSLAETFAPGGAWAAAQVSDSVRAAGSEFARSSLRAVALEHHRKAREAGSADEWRETLRLYGMMLSRWPGDAEAAGFELNAGEASAQLGDYGTALEHYGRAAASGTDSLAARGMWQKVATADAWYESTRGARGDSATALGRDTLARQVITTGDELLARYPGDARGADIVWRQSQLAFAHGWNTRAAEDLGRLVAGYPDDARAPMAAGQRADALFRMEDYEAAGAAFEAALGVARRAGRDSLARRAAQAIPVCYYRVAEAAVAKDSTAHAQHGALFERVAARWPEFEHAHLAQYRAGLAYARAGQTREAVRAMQGVAERFPASEYVRDARLQVAQIYEKAGENEPAARAYVEFAERHPADEGAPATWLKAADLLGKAGLNQESDSLKLGYIRRYPKDVETAMEILEGFARRELAAVTPERPVSKLLPVRAAPKPKTKGKATKAAPTPPPPPASHLADYLGRASAHPDLASRSLIAQVRFLEGEEAAAACSSARLTQPLAKSIPIKQALLDSTLARYRRSVDVGEPLWAHASAFRIGEALVGFGQALEQSERPADLQGEDLRAYGEVLADQSREFEERAEGVWSDLLRQSAGAAEPDEWLTRARSQLWSRLGDRFAYRPEADYPVVAAEKADRAEKPKPAKPEKKGKSRRGSPIAQEERSAP